MQYEQTEVQAKGANQRT